MLAPLDVSTRMIARGVDIEAADALGRMENMAVAAQSFDLITCVRGLETLDYPRPTLRDPAVSSAWSIALIARPGRSSVRRHAGILGVLTGAAF